MAGTGLFVFLHFLFVISTYQLLILVHIQVHTHTLAHTFIAATTRNEHQSRGTYCQRRLLHASMQPDGPELTFLDVGLTEETLSDRLHTVIPVSNNNVSVIVTN